MEQQHSKYSNKCHFDIQFALKYVEFSTKQKPEEKKLKRLLIKKLTYFIEE